MNEDLVFNLIKECTKTFNEIKKKQNEELNTSLVTCLNNLSSLKESLSKNNEKEAEENLLSISVSFIESSRQIINLKYHKYFMNILVLIKKFIEYSLFSKEKSSNLIELLKDFYNNSKSTEECQNKVIEILQTLILTSFFELKYEALSTIYLLVLKSFNNINHSKNKDFKNPIRLIFATLTENVYNSNNFELIIRITVLIFSWYDLSLKKKKESKKRKSNTDINEVISEVDKNTKNNELSEELEENIKEEIISVLSQKKNNVYIQCLSLELLSQGFTIINNKKESEIKKNQFDINFLTKYIKNKITKALIISIENIKKSTSLNEEEVNYLHYLKVCRLIRIIMYNYGTNYEIIQSIIDLINENKNKIAWKTNLSFECFSDIITNYDLLVKIYAGKKELINSIFTCLKEFILYIESLKDDKENKENKKDENIISIFMKKKELDSNKIYIEGDQIEVLKDHSKNFYKKLLNDSIQNIIDSILINNKMPENLDKKNENQESKKEVFDVICNNVKDIISKLLYSEFRLITGNEKLQGDCEIKKYINYLQNMMEIFNNLKMYERRDELLKYLCNLALEFNDDKNDEDKNIFVAISILEIAKATNLLNKEAFALILKTLQVFNRKYNFMKLSEYNSNGLDTILKDINYLYKKYSKSDADEIPIYQEIKKKKTLEKENDKKKKNKKKKDKNKNEEKEEEKKEEEKEKENIEKDKEKEDKDEIGIKEKEEIDEKEKEDKDEKEDKEIKEDKEEKEEKEVKEDKEDKEKKEDKKVKEEKEENIIVELKEEEKDEEKKVEENDKEENKKEDKKKDKKENKKKEKNKKRNSKMEKNEENNEKESNEKEKSKKDKEKEKEKQESKKDKKEKDKDKKESKKNTNSKIDNINNYNFGIELRNKLIEGINTMFIDSKNLNFEELKYIFDALLSCIESSIKKKEEDLTNKKNEIIEKESNQKSSKNKKENKTKKTDTSNEEEDIETIFDYKIIFFFTKILALTLLNIDKIYILFDPFISIINKLIDKKLKVDLCIDMICSLIPSVLLKHEKIELNINQNINEENKIWVNEKWQKLLFTPLLNILSQSNLYDLIKVKIFADLNKIIQQCGQNIDLFGWESIFQLLTILCNCDTENTFLEVKQILNDYNVYITIFNIIPLMELLKTFIFNENEKCSSAIELFWSCANIIDDFKQERRKIKENEKTIYNDLLKGKEINIYCDEVFFKLFSHLISINKDKRIEVRKNGINVFTEIFVSKMKVINPENDLKIINDIFYEVFSSNADKYISNNSDKDLEQTLQNSIINIITILKEFFKENESENELFDKFVNKIIKIIPVGSSYLITDILNSIAEIKTKKDKNMSMITTKLDIYFKILLIIKDYIKSPEFTNSQLNKESKFKLYNGILAYLSAILSITENLEIFSDEDNLKNIFNVINTLFESVNSMEEKDLEENPRKLLEFENDIFTFLEKIPLENISIFNYIIDKMTIDCNNPHSETICRRTLECVQNMICNTQNDKNQFGLKKEEKEIFEKIVEKLKEIISLRKNNEVIESMIVTAMDKKNLKDGLTFDLYISSFVKIIDKMCENFIKYKESLKDEIKEGKKEIINSIYEIFALTLDLFEIIFKQSVEGYDSIKKLYLPYINEIYQQMEIESITFIINKFIFYILYILGDEDPEILEKLKEKIINAIKLCCDISYNNDNIKNISPDILNQICVTQLFELCRYRSNEEILSHIENDKIEINKDKFINNKIKIGKICTKLLIQKIIKLLKKYRDDEISLGDLPMSRVRTKEIIILLQNIKNLEVFPNINLIESNEEEKENNKEDITVFDIVSKTKKIHLFYLQPILNDFINTKEKDIRNLIRELFQEITNIIGIPKLSD